jgi:hypothetical protein
MLLLNRLERAGLPRPELEYRFHPTRRWRVDLAYPHATPPVAVEVEGGGWVRGRHVRGRGFTADLEKYGELTALGWRLVRVDGRLIENGRAVEYVRRALGEG